MVSFPGHRGPINRIGSCAADGKPHPRLGNPRRRGICVVRWQRNLTGYPARLFVPTKANRSLVGVHSSANKAIAMLALSIQLQLSYKQVQSILFMLMFFFS